MELADIYRHQGQFIGGEWLQGAGASATMTNPATEAALGEVANASAPQVEQAIAAAHQARSAMRALTAWQRSALLRRAAP